MLLKAKTKDNSTWVSIDTDKQIDRLTDFVKSIDNNSLCYGIGLSDMYGHDVYTDDIVERQFKENGKWHTQTCKVTFENFSYVLKELYRDYSIDDGLQISEERCYDFAGHNHNIITYCNAYNYRYVVVGNYFDEN